MTRTGRWPVTVLLLLLLGAAVLQGSVAGRLYFLGGQPDFLFAVSMAAAILSDPGAGCLVGLGGGLLTAALVGETVGTILATRTVAGFVAGWLPGRLFRTNALVIVAAVLAASLVSEVIYILAAPNIGLMRGSAAAMVGAGWNAFLALPAAFLLRWCGWGRDNV